MSKRRKADGKLSMLQVRSDKLGSGAVAVGMERRGPKQKVVRS